MLNFHPVNERIIVLPKLADEQVKGIFLPGQAREKQNEKPEVGLVIAVSSDITNVKCKVGDKIIFNKFATTDITSQGKRYLIMLDSSILAVYDDVSEEERQKFYEQI
jgi:chaperonin GroES